MSSLKLALSLSALIALTFTLVGCGGGGGGGDGGGNGGAEILVFTSDRNGNEEIFRSNPDGTGQVNLSNNNAEDDQPAISRDGTKIAFRSRRTGNGEIFIMNADGSGVTNLTNNVAGDSNPSFSPDGTQIAFSSARTPAGIYTMNVDGTNQTLRSGSVPGFEPTWSPDGTTLLFAALVTNTAGSTGREVFTVGADGQGLANLTEAQGDDFMPSFSPNGTQIVFTSRRNFPGSEIYVMNANGSNPTRLTLDNMEVSRPCFSPDGTRIVFISDRDPSQGAPGNFPDVHIMNADGTGRVALTNGESIDARPLFSRDGSEVRFQRGSPSLFPQSDIIVRRADGVFVRNLTLSPSGNGVNSELASN